MLSYRASNWRTKGAHQFRVTLTVPQPAAQYAWLALPVWDPGQLPGARVCQALERSVGHARQFEAGGCARLTKPLWQADCLAGVPLQVSATVYAFTLGAHRVA